MENHEHGHEMGVVWMDIFLCPEGHEIREQALSLNEKFPDHTICYTHGKKALHQRRQQVNALEDVSKYGLGW